MSNELPPLPHPVTNALMGDDFEDLYTADQMREYGRARERAAYERAAELCRQRWKGGYPQEVVNDFLLLALAILKLGEDK